MHKTMIRHQVCRGRLPNQEFLKSEYTFVCYQAENIHKNRELTFNYLLKSVFTVSIAGYLQTFHLFNH